MKWLSLLCLMLFVSVQKIYGTEFIWTSDSASQFPKTLGESYADDIITISGTLEASGTAFIVGYQCRRVTIRGVGGDDRILYGTAGGNNAYGVHVKDSNATIRGLMIAHDPGDNGVYSDPHVDPDTGLSSVSGCTAILLEYATGPTIKACTLIVYGRDAQAVDCFAIHARNVTIDSLNIWNETTRYQTRGNYGGAAIRLECRIEYNPGDWSAHIYRTKVHRASHSGIVVFGNNDIKQKGLEIAQCSVVVDARNDDPDNGQYGSTANCYGIITRFSTSPFSIHDNYLGAGTLWGGSRGITLENLDADPINWAQVYNNTMVQWAGPDAENPTGVYRGFRLRDIDGGTFDNINIYKNYIELTLDTATATKHIGAEGYCIQATWDAGTLGDAHVNIDSNTVVLRVINTDSTSTGIYGACFAGARDDDWDNSKPPINIRWNSFTSGTNIVWGTDKSNGYFADSLEFYACSLAFTDTLSDSGIVMSNARTWYMGGANGDGSGNWAINCWYDTTTIPRIAKDTNITFYINANDLNLIQRINISAVGTDDSLVENANFKVWNGFGTVVLDAPAQASGDVLFDFKYWRTYGTGNGTDVDYNPFDIWVWSGSDTTKLIDKVIDWKTTCLPIHLESTSGTLDASDSCPVFAEEEYADNKGNIQNSPILKSRVIQSPVIGSVESTEESYETDNPHPIINMCLVD